ncbi:MAG: hypothetical protein ACPL4E_09535 [Thermoproteota archaeon]
MIKPVSSALVSSHSGVGLPKARAFYDPEGKVEKLIAEKVRLKESEKKWMIIEGVTQSKWYCNTVSESWVHRGEMVSAHRSVNLALEYLIKALFGLNNQLLPSEKWLVYRAQQLSWLPEGFNKILEEVTLVGKVSARTLTGAETSCTEA